jgi:hypothetical protein
MLRWRDDSLWIMAHATTASPVRQTELPPYESRGSRCLFPTARIKRIGEARRCGVGEDRQGCNGVRRCVQEKFG